MPFTPAVFTIAPTALSVTLTAESVTVDFGPANVVFRDQDLVMQAERPTVDVVQPLSATLDDQDLIFTNDGLIASRVARSVPMSRGVLRSTEVEIGAVRGGLGDFGTQVNYFAVLEADGVTVSKLLAQPLAGFAVLDSDGLSLSIYGLSGGGILIDEDGLPSLNPNLPRPSDTWRELST